MGGSNRNLLTLGFDITGRVVNNEPCPGPGCVIAYIVAAAILTVIAVVLLSLALYQRFKFRRAVTAGSIPASMLMSRWNVAANERGDVDAFAFPVSRPASRAAVNEDCCPICLGTTPKAANWVVFGACGHGTCTSCFKKLASQYRLHAACPLCRKLLATGEGTRGGQRKVRGQEQRQGPAGSETPEAATTATPDPEPMPTQGAVAPLPPNPGRDNHV